MRIAALTLFLLGCSAGHTDLAALCADGGCIPGGDPRIHVSGGTPGPVVFKHDAGDAGGDAGDAHGDRD